MSGNHWGMGKVAVPPNFETYQPVMCLELGNQFRSPVKKRWNSRGHIQCTVGSYAFMYHVLFYRKFLGVALSFWHGWMTHEPGSRENCRLLRRQLILHFFWLSPVAATRYAVHVEEKAGPKYVAFGDEVDCCWFVPLFCPAPQDGSCATVTKNLWIVGSPRDDSAIISSQIHRNLCLLRQPW